jgi:hypothetical protein
MRAQNVKALRELLEEAVAASSGGYRLTSRCVGGDPERSIYDDPGRLAEWLVEAGGVLVPSAVTEQEAMDLLYKVPAEVYARVPEESKGVWFREGMRRIASDTPFGGDDGSGEAVLCLKGTHRWGVSPSGTVPSGPAPGSRPDS